jgi:hypothetical protein
MQKQLLLQSGRTPVFASHLHHAPPLAQRSEAAQFSTFSNRSLKQIL